MPFDGVNPATGAGIPALLPSWSGVARFVGSTGPVFPGFPFAGGGVLGEATGMERCGVGDYSALAVAFSAGNAFKPAAQPTIPAMNSNLSGLADSTPVIMAQPTVSAAPTPTHTA